MGTITTVPVAFLMAFSILYCKKFKSDINAIKYVHTKFMIKSRKVCKDQELKQSEHRQIQPSKPKWEITKITNSQNTKRTYGNKVS